MINNYDIYYIIMTSQFDYSSWSNTEPMVHDLVPHTIHIFGNAPLDIKPKTFGEFCRKENKVKSFIKLNNEVYILCFSNVY